MSENEIQFTNRTCGIMALLLIIGWAISMIIFGVILQEPVNDLIAATVGMAVFPIILAGSAIYKYRFRDERTISILDKAGRNAFFLLTIYLMPLGIIYFSVTESTQDVALVLLGLCLCSIATTIISALYYYKK